MSSRTMWRHLVEWSVPRLQQAANPLKTGRSISAYALLFKVRLELRVVAQQTPGLLLSID